MNQHGERTFSSFLLQIARLQAIMVKDAILHLHHNNRGIPSDLPTVIREYRKFHMKLRIFSLFSLLSRNFTGHFWVSQFPLHVSQERIEFS